MYKLDYTLHRAQSKTVMVQIIAVNHYAVDGVKMQIKWVRKNVPCAHTGHAELGRKEEKIAEKLRKSSSHSNNNKIIAPH